MPKLQLLVPSKQLKFDSGPRLKIQERHVYFSISADIENYLEKIRSPINKVGFVIQLGYFRASGRFFDTELFRPSDVKFVCAILDICLPNTSIDSKTYIANARYMHKNYILKTSGWQKFTKKHYVFNCMMLKAVNKTCCIIYFIKHPWDRYDTFSAKYRS
jgi:hypothetical protein